MSIKNKLNFGFTLIEIIVSLGLFMIVVTISLGAVLGIFDANTRSQSMSSVMNNLSYSLDAMVRTIRFSTVYHCGNSGSFGTPQTCPDNANGDNFFAMTFNGQIYIYRFNNNTIEKSEDGGLTYTPAIGSDVTVQSAKFRVFNTIVGDNKQPYAIITIKGFAGKKPSTQSSFDIETFVSQRQLDI